MIKIKQIELITHPGFYLVSDYYVENMQFLDKLIKKIITDNNNNNRLYISDFGGYKNVGELYLVNYSKKFLIKHFYNKINELDEILKKYSNYYLNISDKNSDKNHFLLIDSFLKKNNLIFSNNILIRNNGILLDLCCQILSNQIKDCLLKEYIVNSNIINGFGIYASGKLKLQ